MTSPEEVQPLSSKGPTLLERVGQGDASAVAELLDAHGALVWSIARKQLGATAAEDVVQEIFIELWKSAHRYDPSRSSEAVFIATIARRRIIDQRRKLGRSPEVAELMEGDSERAERSSDLESIEVADEAKIALEAMAKLKPDQREVLRLTIEEGYTHREVAAMTGLPLGTVKSHARRGLERVRTLLEERRAPGGHAS